MDDEKGLPALPLAFEGALSSPCRHVDSIRVGFARPGIAYRNFEDLVAWAAAAQYTTVIMADPHRGRLCD